MSVVKPVRFGVFVESMALIDDGPATVDAVIVTLYEPFPLSLTDPRRWPGSLLENTITSPPAPSGLPNWSTIVAVARVVDWPSALIRAGLRAMLSAAGGPAVSVRIAVPASGF
jgi:hypothetical protein